MMFIVSGGISIYRNWAIHHHHHHHHHQKELVVSAVNWPLRHLLVSTRQLTTVYKHSFFKARVRSFIAKIPLVCTFISTLGIKKLSNPRILRSIV